MAANVTTMGGRTINILLKADVDWSWDSATEIASVPAFKELSALGHIYLYSITFEPNAAWDVVLVREVSLTGPVFCNLSGQDTYDQRTQYYHGKSFRGLYIDKDDVVSDSDAATLIITLA